MIPVLATLVLLYLWLCWKGKQFGQKYDLAVEMVNETLPRPFSRRSFFSLPFIGFGSVYSPGVLAQNLTQIFYRGQTQRAVLRQLNNIVW